MGRVWECPHGAGVMFSLSLWPQTPVERLAPLSLVIADAVCDALPVAAEVRWPNDIVVGGRKITGVLMEARDPRVTAGIGVNANLTEAELPPATRIPATSLRLETGAAVDRPGLLADLLWALERRYDAFERDGFAGLEHDGLRGHRVSLAGGAEGLCDGVDPAGRLLVAGIPHTSAEVTAVTLSE
jgi:BirA family biotin operon repressor/biotin-[acetyl-CoA-carboxylase] ligase